MLRLNKELTGLLEFYAGNPVSPKVRLDKEILADFIPALKEHLKLSQLIGPKDQPIHMIEICLDGEVYVKIYCIQKVSDDLSHVELSEFMTQYSLFLSSPHPDENGCYHSTLDNSKTYLVFDRGSYH